MNRRIHACFLGTQLSVAMAIALSAIFSQAAISQSFEPSFEQEFAEDYIPDFSSDAFFGDRHRLLIRQESELDRAVARGVATARSGVAVEEKTAEPTFVPTQKSEPNTAASPLFLYSIGSGVGFVALAVGVFVIRRTIRKSAPTAPVALM